MGFAVAVFQLLRTQVRLKLYSLWHNEPLYRRTWYQAFNKGPWDFYRVSLPGRPVKSLLLLGPQLFAYQRERIGERGVSLAVPSHLPKTTCGLCHLAMGKQSDHREQPQQCRCGPAYCQLRPLTLRLESQMPSYLLEGHFQLPTYDEPREDLLRIGLKIGTQEGLSFELSPWVTDQHPAHRHGGQARGVPHGRLGSDLDRALAFTVPVGDRGELPNGSRIFGHLREVWQALALEARSSYLARFARRCRLVEGAIQPKTGDEGDRVGELATAVEELQVQGSVSA